MGGDGTDETCVSLTEDCGDGGGGEEGVGQGYLTGFEEGTTGRTDVAFEVKTEEVEGE
jgi:hypothetical protein